eukprot:763103-Hanusia_phi.AAC.4
MTVVVVHHAQAVDVDEGAVVGARAEPVGALFDHPHLAVHLPRPLQLVEVDGRDCRLPHQLHVLHVRHPRQVRRCLVQVEPPLGGRRDTGQRPAARADHPLLPAARVRPRVGGDLIRLSAVEEALHAHRDAAGVELDARALLLHAVGAVVVHEQLIVDEEEGAVLGARAEAVRPRALHLHASVEHPREVRGGGGGHHALEVLRPGHAQVLQGPLAHVLQEGPVGVRHVVEVRALEDPHAPRRGLGLGGVARHAAGVRTGVLSHEHGVALVLEACQHQRVRAPGQLDAAALELLPVLPVVVDDKHVLDVQQRPLVRRDAHAVAPCRLHLQLAVEGPHVVVLGGGGDDVREVAPVVEVDPLAVALPHILQQSQGWRVCQLLLGALVHAEEEGGRGLGRQVGQVARGGSEALHQ